MQNFYLYKSWNNAFFYIIASKHSTLLKQYLLSFFKNLFPETHRHNLKVKLLKLSSIHTQNFISHNQLGVFHNNQKFYQYYKVIERTKLYGGNRLPKTF